MGSNLRPGDSRCRHHFPQLDRGGPESPWNTEHIDADVSPPFTRFQMTDFFPPLGSLCLIQCLKQFKGTKVLTSSFALSKTSGKLNCHFLVSTPNIHHGKTSKHKKIPNFPKLGNNRRTGLTHLWVGDPPPPHPQPQSPPSHSNLPLGMFL